MSDRAIPAEPGASTGPGISSPAGASPEPVRQRLVLVLPTTAEYDSRTYRIASSVAARGHDVTVLARSGPGLADDERHPSGYRIRRVPVTAVAGLPLPRSMISRLERRGARRRAARSGSDADRAAGGDADPMAEQVGAVGGSGSRPARVTRRAIGAVRRVAAIGLTVRAQSRASRSIDPGADVYHAMAYMGIPVGLSLARRQADARVVYDARDIYLEARNLARLPRLARIVLGRVERSWARASDRVVTVNQAYAEVMTQRFGVEPLVVMNCSYRRDAAAVRPWFLHDATGLPRATRIVLYHGGLAPGRGIDELIEAVMLTPPDVHAVLLGYGPLEASLRERARSAGPEGRFSVLPAVPPDALIDWVASADVVAMLIQPTTLNHRLTTPNKLFEAITAGVPVVASDLPGMAPIVRDTGCGVVCDPQDIPAIAAAIDGILRLPADAYDGLRARTLAAGRERYDWETQVGILLEGYGRLTERPW